MKPLLNLNNFYLLVLLIFLSCDNTTNDNSCSGSKVRDNCGICRLPDDEDFNSCYDECGVQNGLSDCSEYGKCMGLCPCLGCNELGNLEYNPEALFTSQCACDNESLLSNYIITDLYSNHQINFSFIESGGTYTNNLTITNNNNENLTIFCGELGINSVLNLNSFILINNQNFNLNNIQQIYTIEISNANEELISSINILTSVYPLLYFENILESCNICNCSYEDNICCEDEFQCTDGSCIDGSKICNGTNDCENGLDEFGCGF